MKFSLENVIERYTFPCGTELYCTIKLIHKIKCKQLIYFQGKRSCYAYFKNILTCRAVFRFCKVFLLRAVTGPSSCRKN
jgi:hypothetical protein